jgi:hypothetical protein
MGTSRHALGGNLPSFGCDERARWEALLKLLLKKRLESKGSPHSVEYTGGLAGQATGEVIRWHGQTGQLFYDGNDRIVFLSANRAEVLGIFHGASGGHL